MKAVARCDSCEHISTVLIYEDEKIYPIGQHSDCCEKGEYEVLEADFVKSSGNSDVGWKSSSD
ncbi:hypothetical protein ACFQKF_13055 [Halalkalicoccus sp. GCM10025322]|uniref:hypothetical protein n=1 Tax=Halalkalicoccus TaxID=332246 RepID=UPI002F9667C3